MRVEKLNLEVSLQQVKDQLNWEKVDDSAREWWDSLEELNQDRMHLVLRLAQELQKRNVTIDDFHAVWIHSNLDDVRANLEFLDVLMQDNEHHRAPSRDRTAVFRKVNQARVYH